MHFEKLIKLSKKYFKKPLKLQTWLEMRLEKLIELLKKYFKKLLKN